MTLGEVRYTVHLTIDELLQLELFTRRTARGCKSAREKLKDALAMAKRNFPGYFEDLKKKKAEKKAAKIKRNTEPCI